jgi:hypothetical protein
MPSALIVAEALALPPVETTSESRTIGLPASWIA